MRSESYVYDVNGGYFLTGIPSLELYIADGDREAYLGGWSSREWVMAEPGDEEWDYDIRTVRVVTKRDLVRGLLKFVCELAREVACHIENRNEAAYERSLSDYYGGDGPQTDRERQVEAWGHK